jgi:hypothetical protein
MPIPEELRTIRIPRHSYENWTEDERKLVHDALLSNGWLLGKAATDNLQHSGFKDRGFFNWLYKDPLTGKSVGPVKALKRLRETGAKVPTPFKQFLLNARQSLDSGLIEECRDQINHALYLLGE